MTASNPGACPQWVLEYHNWIGTSLEQQSSWSNDVITAHNHFDCAIGARAMSMRSQKMSGFSLKLADFYSLNTTQCAPVWTAP